MLTVIVARPKQEMHWLFAWADAHACSCIRDEDFVAPARAPTITPKYYVILLWLYVISNLCEREESHVVKLY